MCNCPPLMCNFHKLLNKSKRFPSLCGPGVVTEFRLVNSSVRAHLVCCPISVHNFCRKYATLLMYTRMEISRFVAFTTGIIVPWGGN